MISKGRLLTTMDNRRVKGRKYLFDLGLRYRDIHITSPFFTKQVFKWRKQRKTYGFDERATWALDGEIAILFYERLKMFNEVTEDVIDKKFHKYEIEGKTYTLQECINEMIYHLGMYLIITAELDTEKAFEHYDKFLVYYSKCYRSLWW